MLKKMESDFLVVGSGIAGLYTALKLSQLGRVLVLTKENKKESNTSYAQGGIAAVMAEDDSYSSHLKDTLAAGAGHCYLPAVELLVKKGPERIRDLIALGTEFDLKDSNFDLTREGGHSQRRVLHARGDATGKEISESLLAAAKKSTKIEIKEDFFLFDLLTAVNEKGEIRVSGVLAKDKRKEDLYIIQAAAVILAAGGAGQLFARTSNPELTTGDGIAAAFRAGADLIDLEFMQFHPTALAVSSNANFLISESVRGEGALLLNEAGERFMPAYHPQAELAPRDIVARAIIKEIKKGEGKSVYLDFRDLDSFYLKNRFPTIYQTVLKAGLDLTKELIPIRPAAHYLMGGIKTDLKGRSSLQGLFACGENAWTGVHGANRLASNSLLEAVVFAEEIFNYLQTETISKKYFFSSNSNLEKLNYNFENRFQKLENLKITESKAALLKESEKIKKELQQKMSAQAGILRNKTELRQLLDWLNKKSDYYNQKVMLNNWSQQSWEVKNLFLIARLMLQAALKRQESRGAHYRSDFPDQKKRWSSKYIIFNKQQVEGEINVIK